MQALGPKFQELLAYFLPVLFRILPITVQVSQCLCHNAGQCPRFSFLKGF